MQLGVILSGIAYVALFCVVAFWVQRKNTPLLKVGEAKEGSVIEFETQRKWVEERLRVYDDKCAKELSYYQAAVGLLYLSLGFGFYPANIVVFSMVLFSITVALDRWVSSSEVETFKFSKYLLVTGMLVSLSILPMAYVHFMR